MKVNNELSRCTIAEGDFTMTVFWAVHIQASRKAGLYAQLIQRFECRCYPPTRTKSSVTERSLDKVAFLGSSDLDGPRASYRGSDNLVAGDRDDLVGAAAR